MRWINLVVAVAAVAACNKNSVDEPTAAGRSAADPETEQSGEGGAVAPDIHIPAGVPAEAIGVAVVNLPGAARELWSLGFLGPMSSERAEALDEELDAYLENKVGVRVGGVTSAHAFLVAEGDEPAAALLVSGIEGELRTDKTGTHGGIPLHDAPETDVTLALRDDVLLVGMEPAVVAALDVLAGDAEALAEDSMLGRLLAEDLGSGYLAAALDPRDIPDDELQEMRERFGVEGVAAAIGPAGIRGVARGKDEGLQQIAALANAALAQAVSEMNKEKEAAKADEPAAAAVGAIFAAHHLEAAIDKVEPVVEGGKLTFDAPLTMQGPMMTTALIGMVAAVAVPAFLEYKMKAEMAGAGAPPGRGEAKALKAPGAE